VNNSESGPNFLNYVQHILPGVSKKFAEGLRPLVTGLLLSRSPLPDFVFCPWALTVIKYQAVDFCSYLSRANAILLYIHCIHEKRAHDAVTMRPLLRVRCSIFSYMRVIQSFALSLHVDYMM